MNYKEKLYKTRVLFFVILSLSIILRMANIISEQLWHDEGGTIFYVNSTMDEFWRQVIEEVAPPLYYLLLKGWVTIFGTSIFATRLLSVIFSVLTLPILYLLGKEIKNEKIGLIIIFLFSISPFSIWYANEVRMYSFLQLIFTIDLYFAIKCIKYPNDTKNYVFFAIMGVCLIYTHYSGFLYLGLLGFGIIIFNRKGEGFLKNVIISTLIILISYIPWIPYAIEDALVGPIGYTGGRLTISNFLYWVFYYIIAPVPSSIDNPYVVRLIILSFLINLPLLILSIISSIGFIYSYKDKEYFDIKDILFFLIIFTILFFGLNMLFGLLVPNSFQVKNLIGGLSVIYIFESFGLYYLFFDENSSFRQGYKKLFKIFDPKTLKKIFMPILGAVLICNIIVFPIFKNIYLQKPDWEGVVKKIDKNFENNDIIINQYGVNKLPDVMEYYCDLYDFDLEENSYGIDYKNNDEIEEFYEYIRERGILRIWIVTHWRDVYDPNDEMEDELIDKYNLTKIEYYYYRLDITLMLYSVS